jgi:hypothetical protein
MIFEKCEERQNMINRIKESEGVRYNAGSKDLQKINLIGFL